MVWLILLIGIALMATIVEITEEFKLKLMVQNREKRELLEEIKEAILLIETLENNDDLTKQSVHKNSIKEILFPIVEKINLLEPYSVDNDYL